MRYLALLLVVAACGQGSQDKEAWSKDRKKDDYALPVRVAQPERGDVDDYIETQANLESDVAVTILAEVEARVVARIRDVGAVVGGTEDGEDPMLLARLDDRDHKLALRDAEIDLEDKQGRVQELELELRRNEQLVEQANVALREAEAIFRRTSNGITDGTISGEEHETSTFGRNRSRTMVLVAQAAFEKSKVALKLGKIAVRKSEVTRDRARIELESTSVRAPFPGTVTMCQVDVGEWVTKGMELYRVEDTSKIVVYGDLPVRQATRVKPGNTVLIGSTATAKSTTGEVLMVEPTVNSASGTVRVKMRVRAEQGYKPGLFVSLRIVVENRKGALVVPKRAVLHDDEEGPYVFVVKDDEASRVAVQTGFEREDVVEIVSGIAEDASVVVEGQDTLADGAKVQILPAE
ncbi:MAG: efflux RND transporter periplasmic adaptor subunit [Planctomycetota bacterium]